MQCVSLSCGCVWRVAAVCAREGCLRSRRQHAFLYRSILPCCMYFACALSSRGAHRQQNASPAHTNERTKRRLRLRDCSLDTRRPMSDSLVCTTPQGRLLSALSTCLPFVYSHRGNLRAILLASPLVPLPLSLSLSLSMASYTGHTTRRRRRPTPCSACSSSSLLCPVCFS